MTRIKSMMWFLAVPLAFGVLVFVAPQSVSAQSDKDSDRVKKEKTDKDDKLTPEDRKNVKITMEQARASALARISGTVIDEELEKEDGRLQYAFDIRTSEGKVFDVEIDAQSGEVIKAVQDDDDDDKDDDGDDD